jgi:hypothetical protein
MALPYIEPAVKLTRINPLPDVAESIVGGAGGCATKILEVFGAENVNDISALEAKSAIDPLFRSMVFEIEIPSVSNSEVLLATVYLNKTVLLSV